MEFDDFIKTVLIDPLRETIGSGMLGVKILVTLNFISRNMKKHDITKMERIFALLKMIGLSLLLVPVIFAHSRLFDRFKNVLSVLGTTGRIFANIIKILIKGMNFNIFIPLFVSFSIVPLAVMFEGFSLALQATALKGGSDFANAVTNGSTSGKSIIEKIMNLFRIRISNIITLFIEFLNKVKNKLLKEFPLIEKIVNFFKKIISKLRALITKMKLKITQTRLQLNESIADINASFKSFIFSILFSFLFKGIIGKVIGALVIFLMLSSPVIRQYLRRIPFIGRLFGNMKSQGAPLLKSLHIEQAYSEMKQITDMAKAGKLIWDAQKG